LTEALLEVIKSVTLVAERSNAVKKTVLAPFIVSVVGIGLFMSHFWQSFPTSAVLWALAGASGIFCIYAGLIHRSETEKAIDKAILKAASVIGGIILFGIILSAIFIFVPQM
jgi:hypothetical protein